MDAIIPQPSKFGIVFSSESDVNTAQLSTINAGAAQPTTYGFIEIKGIPSLAYYVASLEHLENFRRTRLFLRKVTYFVCNLSRQARTPTSKAVHILALRKVHNENN